VSDKIKGASLEALVFAAEFVRWSAPEQRNVMLKRSDTGFFARDEELVVLAQAERRQRNEMTGLQSDLSAKRARLAVIGDPGPDAPTQDISTAALRAEVDKHLAAENEFANHAHSMSNMAVERDRLMATVSMLTTQLQQANEALAAHNTRFFDHASCAPPKPDPNAISEIAKSLQAAEKHNERCRQGREKKKLEAELLSLQQAIMAKEKELGQIESEKMALLNLDALVPGLRCTETEALLNEKPLSEASLEQQMEVGLAVYEAQKKGEITEAAP
jgi:hypothetical protein